jgi:hypothetical protein
MMTTKNLFMSADLSSRGKRRKVVILVIDLLMRIRTAEQTLIERMPLNLHGSTAYDTAEYAIDILDEVIDVISSVYD